MSKEEEKIERGSTKLAVKAGFWYVFGTFITKGLAFILAPIFAHLMTKGDYGEFSNFANWTSTLVIIVGFELQNTLSRAYYDFKEDYDRYASTVCYTDFIFAFIFYAIFILLGDSIYSVVSIPKEYTFLLFFALLFQGAKSAYLAKERTLYRYKDAAKISIISMGVPLILSIILVFFVSEDMQLSARLYGFYVPYALVGLYCAYDLIKKGKGFKFNYFKYSVALALPLFIHTLTTYLLYSANTMITKSVLGAESAAVVSVSTSVMNIIVALFTSVSGAITTWVMDNLELKRYDKPRKCSYLLSASIGLIAIGVMLLGPEVVLIFGGKNYSDALLLIPGLAFSIVFQTVNAFCTIIFTYYKKVYTPAITTLIITISTIFIKIKLLPTYGYKVLPIVNIFAFILVFICNYIILCIYKYNKAFSLKGVLLTILVPLGFMLISPYLYAHPVVRFIVIGVLVIIALIILYLTKDKWLKILENRKNKKKQITDQ